MLLATIFVNKKQPSQIIPGPDFIYKQTKTDLTTYPYALTKMSLFFNIKYWIKEKFF